MTNCGKTDESKKIIKKKKYCTDRDKVFMGKYRNFAGTYCVFIYKFFKN